MVALPEAMLHPLPRHGIASWKAKPRGHLACAPLVEAGHMKTDLAVPTYRTPDRALREVLGEATTWTGNRWAHAVGSLESYRRDWVALFAVVTSNVKCPRS